VLHALGLLEVTDVKNRVARARISYSCGPIVVGDRVAPFAPGRVPGGENAAAGSSVGERGGSRIAARRGADGPPAARLRRCGGESGYRPRDIFALMRQYGPAVTGAGAMLPCRPIGWGRRGSPGCRAQRDRAADGQCARGSGRRPSGVELPDSALTSSHNSKSRGPIGPGEKGDARGRPNSIGSRRALPAVTEREARWACGLLPQLGGVALQGFVDTFGSVSAAWAAAPDALRRVAGIGPVTVRPCVAFRGGGWSARIRSASPSGVTVIVWGDAEYRPLQAIAVRTAGVVRSRRAGAWRMRRRWPSWAPAVPRLRRADGGRTGAGVGPARADHRERAGAGNRRGGPPRRPGVGPGLWPSWETDWIRRTHPSTAAWRRTWRARAPSSASSRLARHRSDFISREGIGSSAA